MYPREPATLRVAAQVLGAVLAGVGTATVVAAPRVAAAVASDGRSVPDPRIVRVLGARQAVQGVLIVRDPSAAALGLGGLVDASHALSMLPVVVAWPRFRRPAAISAAIAIVTAGIGRALAERSAPRSG